MQHYVIQLASSPGTDRHDITEILLKVALNTIKLSKPIIHITKNITNIYQRHIFVYYDPIIFNQICCCLFVCLFFVVVVCFVFSP